MQCQMHSAPLPTPAPSPYLPAMNLRTHFFRFALALALCLLPTLSPTLSPAADTERPDLARLFEARGVEGCFVARTPEGVVRVNAARAAQRYRPASTFKILNALVALESGVALDTGKVLLWDGVKREVPLWNSDLSMNEAFRSSAVWYFVEIGKQNGRERLGKAMREVGYGNADASGSDQFWLDGPLRISADEQAVFMERLVRGEVPFVARHRAMVARMMLLEEGASPKAGGVNGAGDALVGGANGSGGRWALYAKTGLARLGGGPGEAEENFVDMPVGWLVGWVERDSEGGRHANGVEQGGAAKNGPEKFSSGAPVRIPFALNISPARQPQAGATGANPSPFGPARMEIAKDLLRELGVLPPK